MGDVGRGAAHVERDDASVARVRRGLGRAHDAAGGSRQDGVLPLEQPRVGEPPVRLHEHETHVVAEIVRHPVDVAAQQGREVRIRHRGVAAADELHQWTRSVAGGHLAESDISGEAAEFELVLRVAVAVHEHDGDRPDSVFVCFTQGLLGPGHVEGSQDVAVRRHPAVHLRNPLMEHLGQRDSKVEQMRPGLVADAKRVAEPAVHHEQGSVPLAFEEGVGGDGGAHLDAVDAGDGRSRGNTEQVADALNGGVAIVLRIVGQELAGGEGAVGSTGHHVGEGSAAIDPELPANGFAVHPVLRPESQVKRRRGLSMEWRPMWHRCRPEAPP